MIPDVAHRHDGGLPPYGLRKAIETIKASVPIERAAVEYGEFKLLGNGRLLGRCVATDHTDKTPSMTIFTDSQRFKCFGCQISGDVIDLCEVAERHADAWTAVISLSTRFGVELPKRPPEWHRWQTEKHQLRRELCRVMARSYQRRLFRVFSPITLDNIEDPSERKEEGRRIWEELGPPAYNMAWHKVFGGERG